MAGGSVDAIVDALLPEHLHRLARVSGAPVVFGGTAAPGPRTDRLVITRLRGTRGQSLRGLVVPSGRGLGGAVLRDRRPQRVEDYASTSAITHDYDRIVVREERLTAVFAAPVVVGGTACGILYGAAREEQPLGDRALRSVEVVAAQLGRAVQDALSPPDLDPDPLEELAAVIADTADPVQRARLERIHARLRGPAQAAAGLLTPRELDVLRAAASGAGNLEIAAGLGLSPQTVKAYLRSAMRKLGVRNRSAAVRAAGLR